MKKSFSISPRILSHLGEDLIKNESIALLELVKNSYDACATECSIYFETNKHGQLKSIIVQDNGFGMDKSLIENVWLRIGTDNKFKNIKPNSCGRIPLGEKGIGRLSVHKLGDTINLFSKSKDSKEVHLEIDWTQLNKATKIDDFLIEVNEVPDPVIFKKGTGTKIEINNLKTGWDRRQLREVHRNLTSLNSPFSENTDTFKVNVTSNSNLFDGLPDFEDLKNAALYFGHCKMEKNQIVDFRYEFKPWDSLLKMDKGRIKRFKDLHKEDRNIIDSTRDANIIDLESHKIGPIEFDLIIYEMDSQIFSYVNSEKKSIKDYLRENGGIRVYRDGVRVYDYGERENDWLGIDLKRVHRVGGNVSNNIIIGSVKINRADSFGLKEKTNREGFIENESYQAFTDAVNYALSLFVRERNIDKSVLTTLYKKHKAIEPVLSDLSDVSQYVEDNVKEPDVKGEILKYLNRINDQYAEVKEVLIKSANAGLNLSVVIHEIDKLIAQLTGCIERNEKQKAINISQALEKIVRGYSAMIKKSEIRETPLSRIVETALNNYEFRFLDHKISIFSNWQNNDLKAYLAEAEATSVLTNLLDNAVYWLSFARKEDRKISIYITDQIKNYNSIIVSDNGPGFNIPFDVAVKPFLTGKPHNIGSGLGLHVANEMMTAMKGKLLFLDENEIELPILVKRNEITQAILALCFPKKK